MTPDQKKAVRVAMLRGLLGDIQESIDASGQGSTEEEIVYSTVEAEAATACKVIIQGMLEKELAP